MCYSSMYVVLQQLYNFSLAQTIVIVASVCGNGETGRHGYTNQVHLSQIGTFTTEQISHVCLTFGLTVTE